MKLPIEALTDEWKAYRHNRISGTDVPAILGLSRWATPLSVWMRVTGRAHDDAEGEYLEWGSRMEDINRAWTQDDLKLAIEPNRHLWAHPDREWLVCTPDGFFEKEGELCYWEGKAPSVWTKDDWNEGMPLQYQCQVAIGLEITDTDLGLLSALIQPGPPKWGWLKRDKVLAQKLLDQIDCFWEEHVIKDVPPGVSGERDRGLVNKLHPEDSGATVAMPDHLCAITDEIDRLKEQADATADLMEQKKNEVRMFLGENTYGAMPDGSGWKYARNARGARVLRRVSKLRT